MRSNYKINDDFIIRTPRFSLEHFKIENKATNEEMLSLIKKYYSEEIYYDSAQLYNSLFEQKEELSKLVLPLRKYLIRSSTRCTPFGLNASIGKGKFAKNEDLIIDVGMYKKDILLDFDWYINLINYIEKRLGDNLLVKMNNTLNINEHLIFNCWIDAYKKEYVNSNSVVLNNVPPLKIITELVKKNYRRLNLIIL